MDLLKSLEFATTNTLAAKPLRKTAIQSAAHFVLFAAGTKKKPAVARLGEWLSDWQQKEALTGEGAVQKFSTASGVTVWLLQPNLLDSSNASHGHNGRLTVNSYGRARDLAGGWLRANKIVGDVAFEFMPAREEEMLGALVGLGLAGYNYLESVRGGEKGGAKTDVQVEKTLAPLKTHEAMAPIKTDKVTASARTWTFFNGRMKVADEIMDQAVAIFTGMNMARHLTSTPAGDLNPETMSATLTKFFAGVKNLKVEVWDVARLKKEKMGLLLGVGAGSQTGARMVHMKYRPAGAKKTRKPYAFVGKGVTFDTGGLDIKPASGMRWMKKDMAGSAVMAGLCHMVASLKLATPCDFYLALAENAISATATRPGDVHVARNGLMVEIDNTDAEGRLVMADAFDVAVTKEGADAPAVLFDVATLTGAMRVAVGLDVAGFFANDDEWARKTEKAAQNFSELAWRMPLVQKYKKGLSSNFADCKNSNDSGFGGAITAALFLEKFVGNTPWVHLDLMSWNNSPEGAIGDGANAQGFQILAGILLS